MNALSQTGALAPESTLTREKWLVIGMGSFAYGKERRAVNALKHMPRIHPHFLTTVWEDGSVSELLHRQSFGYTPVTVGYLGRARLRWTLTNLRLMPQLFVKTVRVYIQQSCVGILVLALPSFANLLPALWWLRVIYRARLVFYLGDIPANTGPNRLLARVINRLDSPVIAVSEAVKRGLIEIGFKASRIDIVLNGVELDRFSPFIDKRTKSDAVTVVGYMGQMSERKGIFDFIEAARIVHEREPRCRFLCFGKLEDQNTVHREILEQSASLRRNGILEFAGYTSEASAAYRNMDIVVMPSKHEEALGNVALEAAASGLPVIATKAGGIPETVLHGRTGYLVQKSNPREIAERIVELARDHELRGQLGANARRIAQERFDVRKSARLVEDIMFLNF